MVLSFVKLTMMIPAESAPCRPWHQSLNLAPCYPSSQSHPLFLNGGVYEIAMARFHSWDLIVLLFWQVLWMFHSMRAEHLVLASRPVRPCLEMCLCSWTEMYLVFADCRAYPEC